jgi:anti-sigma-K factor RskA
MTHEEIFEDLPLLALGSLDPDERRVVQQHLDQGCDRCAPEIAAWQQVVATLALEDDEIEVPNLKPQLLSRARDSQRPPRRARWQSALRTGLALAAAVVLVIAAVVELGVRHQLDERTAEVAVLRRQVAEGQSRFQQIAAQLAAKEQDVAALRTALVDAQEGLAVARARELRFVRLQQTADAKAGRAHALVDIESGRGLFYAFDLPPVPEDKAYELWWITEAEGPVNAGVFKPDERGLGRLHGSVPTNAGAIQAAAVTIEPAAGVPKPTGPMILLGELGES